MNKHGKRARYAHGFALLELVIALAVAVGILYFFLNQKRPGAVPNATVKQLEASSVQIPPVPSGVPSNDPEAIQKAVEAELDRANAENKKRLDCATDEEGCKVQ